MGAKSAAHDLRVAFMAQSVISLRPCVAVWLITWLTTVPLFHIHLPDISSSQAAHFGVAHTVFSPDLPGEFTSFSHAKPQDPFTQLTHWIFNSPELGFVLSEDSEEREKGKPLVLGIRGSFLEQPFMPSSTLESPRQHWQCPVVVTPYGPRAPPSVVSS